MQSRPVLMPGGWPENERERDACSRLLLACGGDFMRVFDELALDVEAYVHRVARIRFSTSPDQYPLFFVTGHIDRIFDLVNLYARITETTAALNHSSWVVFALRKNLDHFLDDAEAWADIDEEYDDIYFWRTAPRPMLIATSKSDPSLVRRALVTLDSDPRFRSVTTAAQSGTKMRTDVALDGETVVSLDNKPRVRRDAG